MQLYHAPTQRKPTRDKRPTLPNAELSGATRNSSERQTWRSWLRIHPTAEIFDLLHEDDLCALAEDIKQYGLREPVSFIKDESEFVLLDGRNRLDALELHGKEITHDTLNDSRIFKQLPASIDVTAFIVSSNIHRRHLTAEDKRKLIGKLIKATPESSNLQIAKAVKADDKTVAKVRRELEATSEIPRLEKTVGADGKARKRPARTATAKKKPRFSRWHSLQNRVRDLKAENRKLLDERSAAHKEVDDLKRPIKQGALITVWDRASSEERRDFVMARKLEILQSQQDIEQTTYQSPDDGLDIPDYLRRAPKEGATS
jgi:hypothetical protein